LGSGSAGAEGGASGPKGWPSVAPPGPRAGPSGRAVLGDRVRPPALGPTGPSGVGAKASALGTPPPGSEAQGG
jgi:hypothetical protein